MSVSAIKHSPCIVKLLNVKALKYRLDYRKSNLSDQSHHRWTVNSENANMKETPLAVQTVKRICWEVTAWTKLISTIPISLLLQFLSQSRSIKDLVAQGMTSGVRSLPKLSGTACNMCHLLRWPLIGIHFYRRQISQNKNKAAIYMQSNRRVRNSLLENHEDPWKSPSARLPQKNTRLSLTYFNYRNTTKL